MNNLSKFGGSAVALLVALYGGYELYVGQDTQIDQLKFVVLTVMGVLYLITNHTEDVKEVFLARKPTSERVFSPAEFERRDFDCLIHLRNRLTEAGCVEGVETCEKLNNIVFSLHAKEKMKLPVNKNV